MQENVVLIGMPGSGKSTVGVVLAKRTGRGFVDTDLLIQSRAGRTLQQIIDTDGYDALLAIEQDSLLGLDVDRHVIATGGSAVYCERGMEHLKRSGAVVFLDVDLPTLQRRVGDYSERGIALRPGQSFDELFAERDTLYRRWADFVVDGAATTADAVCRRIEAVVA